MKKVLVTGGTGFIGSALVRRLVKEGFHVRVLDDESRGAVGRLSEVQREIEFVAGDVRNAEVVEKACRNIDSVFHLAFVNGTEFFYSKPDHVLDVGVRGIINVIDGCIKNKVQEFILASSSEVYQTPPKVPTDETVPMSIPDPLNPRYSYGGGKIISELMAINYGRKFFDRVLIFRPHNVYGPDMGWEHVLPQFILRMKRLIKEVPAGLIPFPIQGTGEETRSFNFISDFVDGLMVLFEKGQHLNIYHVGTMEELRMKDVAILVGNVFGRNIEIVPKEGAQGGTARRCPDIGKLSSLGYRPRVLLREGLPIIARWYDEHSHLAPKKN